MQVDYIQHMGSDLTVVNAARVSFDLPVTNEIDDKSKGLINFLARGFESKTWKSLIQEFANETDLIKIESKLKEFKKTPTHWTPFSHETITLRETVPIFVARQRFKHKVGFSENEVSRRYRTEDLKFFTPEMWRKAAINKKQGSVNEPVSEIFDYIDYQNDDTRENKVDIKQVYNEHIKHCMNVYNSMIDSGVCAEQARMVLPQSMMTSYYVTGSLYAFASLYNTRSKKDAQSEIRDLADKISKVIQPLFPISWEALTQ